MLRYVNGYIFEGHTFVVNKSDIHNAKDEQFAEGTALMPDGWISVEDRLPDDERDVLILYDRYGGEYGIGFYSAHGMFGPHWVKGGAMLVYNVTYWMPLPEPPKGLDET